MIYNARVNLFGRCAALDERARRCRHAAVRWTAYHGDQEIYGGLGSGPEPGWVRVGFCERHSAQPKRRPRA